MNSELSADLLPGERDDSSSLLVGVLGLERFLLYERLSRELDLVLCLRDLLLLYDLERSSVRRDLDLLDLLLVLERDLDLLLRLGDDLDLLLRLGDDLDLLLRLGDDLVFRELLRERVLERV